MVVLGDTIHGVQSELLNAVPLGRGKILPGLVGKAEVSRSLQHPEVRTRRICKFDQDIRHVEELSKVQSDVDLVELQPPGERGALPPALCPIDGVRYGVRLVAVRRGADVAVLALDGLVGVPPGQRPPDQLAVQILHGSAAAGSRRRLLPAGGGGGDAGALGQVEVGRVQAVPVHVAGGGAWCGGGGGRAPSP